jgi:hypothetical protein
MQWSAAALLTGLGLGLTALAQAATLPPSAQGRSEQWDRPGSAVEVALRPLSFPPSSSASSASSESSSPESFLPDASLHPEAHGIATRTASQCPASPELGRFLTLLRTLDESGSALAITQHAKAVLSRGQPPADVLDGMIRDLVTAMVPLYPELLGSEEQAVRDFHAQHGRSLLMRVALMDLPRGLQATDERSLHWALAQLRHHFA